MKPAARPLRLAAAAGLILAAAVAAIVGGRSYSGPEQAAEPETLQRIARKNEAAAMHAAAKMEARSDAAAAARESDEPRSVAASTGQPD